MQKDTKNLLSQAFIEQLNRKPFDKITIKDIVDEAGVNRNTFYYYYSDVYDLLEEIFKKEMMFILNEHDTQGSYLKAFVKVAQTAYNRKKVINNICSSRSYDYFENYMYKACNHIIVDFVKSLAGDMKVPDKDVEFIAAFYEYAFVGIISEWFRTGMREEPLELAGQISLVVGGVRLALKQSERRTRDLSDD